MHRLRFHALEHGRDQMRISLWVSVNASNAWQVTLDSEWSLQKNASSHAGLCTKGNVLWRPTEVHCREVHCNQAVLAGAPWEHSVMGLEGKGAVAGVQRCQCFCTLQLQFYIQSLWCHGLASSVLQQHLAPSFVSSAQECRTSLKWMDMLFVHLCLSDDS